MNRNRQGGRDNRSGGGRNFRGGRDSGGFGDGLLGEGPPVGGGSLYNEQLASQNQMNQLMLAQTLLQQQALAAGAGFGGGNMGDMGGIGALAGNMNFLNNQGHQVGHQGGYGGGGMTDRKRMANRRGDRGVDMKRRRHDSTGRDRDRSGTRDVGRGGEGRDRNRFGRRDSDRGGKRDKEDDYDPAEPTEDDDHKDKDSNLYCHVCNVSVYDDESFKRHLNGSKHQQRMNNVLTVHQMKSNQLKSRLKAEEHLRKIEGGRDPDYFCKICNNDLTIPWKYHSTSHIHRQRLLQVRRGCGWCGRHDFSNFTEVLEHRETEEHKKNAEIHGKNEEKDKKRDRRREKKEEEEEDLTIPEFDAEKPVGLKYIVPVTGFFCKLCHKFYNNEKSAKGAHCQSEAHYEKFKAATEVKIAEREKRKAEDAAKAEEEAAVKAEKGEDGDETMDTSEAGGEEKKESGGEEDEEELDDQGDEQEEDDDEKDLSGGDINGDDHDQESLLDDTGANTSFEFVSGDAVKETEQEEEGNAEDAGAEDAGAEDAGAEDAGAEEETSQEAEADTTKDEEEEETPKPKAKATARRGRGRGKARK